MGYANNRTTGQTIASGGLAVYPGKGRDGRVSAGGATYDRGRSLRGGRRRPGAVRPGSGCRRSRRPGGRPARLRARRGGRRTREGQIRARSQPACRRSGSVAAGANRRPRRPSSCPGTPAIAASPPRLAEARYLPRTARARSALLSPPHEAFQKIAVRAADIEKASITRDCPKYRLALRPPADGAAVKARLLDGIVGGEVGVFEGMDLGEEFGWKKLGQREVATGPP